MSQKPGQTRKTIAIDLTWRMAPIWLKYLKTYYLRDEEKDLPVISAQTAVFLSVLFTIFYVLPFYLSSTTRPSPAVNRDAPSVIRARVRAVTATCVLTSLATVYLITYHGKATLLESLRLMGWWPISAVDIFHCWLLTGILFAGPIFEAGICEGEWRNWLRKESWTEVLGSWIGWRNQVAGPVTEEVLFRSVIIPLHLLAKVAPKNIIFACPLYFGIAHIHHFYEFRLTHPHTPIPPAIIRSAFQFGYTTIFGWYASFLYLRTGSLVAVILVHSFCNWCGLPRLWGRVEAGEPIGPPVSPRPKEDGDKFQVAHGRLGLGWTVAYYIILVAGAMGFYRELWPLSESSQALVAFAGKPK